MLIEGDLGEAFWLAGDTIEIPKGRRKASSSNSVGPDPDSSLRFYRYVDTTAIRPATASIHYRIAKPIFTDESRVWRIRDDSSFWTRSRDAVAGSLFDDHRRRIDRCEPLKVVRQYRNID